MDKYITISLSNGLFNAGVLGLYKLLKFCDYGDYQIEEQDIKINKEFFLKDNLAELYLDILFDYFEMESSFYNFVNTDYDQVDDKKIRDINIFKQKGLIDLINTVCDIYNYKEFPKLRDEYNELINIAEKKDKIKEIQQYLKQNKEIYRYLVIGDITRSILRLYFGTFAYFDANKGYSIKKENFEDSLNNFLFNKLRTLIKDFEKFNQFNEKYMVCFECRNSYSGSSKKEFIELKFINDFVTDPDKKQSVFWNNNSDAFVCPLCTFIYLLMPLGFIPVAKGTYSKDRLFVNSNDSIESLIKINQSVSSKKELFLENNKLIVLNTIVAQKIMAKQREIDNIEIILRESHEKRTFYSFNIIGKDILEVIQKSQENLQSLVYKRVRLKSDSKKKNAKDEWIYVFNEVLNNILSYRNQWNFLNLLFRLDAKPDINVGAYTLNNVYQIQLNQNSIKEGRDSMKEMKKSTLSARYSGMELQEFFGEEAENKLRGYIYKLVNALSVGDKELFLDTVVRMYCGINKEVPNTFINLFADDENFKEIGYAYLLGLKAKLKDKNDQKEEKKL